MPTEAPAIKSFPRGYRNPPQLRAEIAAAHRTGFFRTSASALTDGLAIQLLLVLAAVILVRDLPLLWESLLAIITIVLCGRQFRALECLVHEAAHFNWSRGHRVANDLAANLLAGFPCGAQLTGYRRSHLLHHGRFGTTEDPDRRRYEELQLEDLPRTSALAYVGAMLPRLYRYQLSWLRESGNPAEIGKALLWAVLMVVTPSYLLGQTPAALLAAGLWALSFFGSLTVIRFVAEANEHQYRTGTTVFSATVSNLGWIQRAVFHPHGDGYHSVHHLWPGVPHHRIARLHETLLDKDPVYAANVLVRTATLSQPKAIG